MLRVTWPDELIDDVGPRIKGRILMFAQIVAQKLNNEMVINTPVRFGFLRGSWFAGLNEVPEDEGSRDPSGGNAIASANEVALTLTIGDIYYLVNTAVYAARLEYGFFGVDKLGRHINQAGRGFVRAAVARFPQLCNETVDEIVSGRYDE